MFVRRRPLIGEATCSLLLGLLSVTVALDLFVGRMLKPEDLLGMIPAG